MIPIIPMAPQGRTIVSQTLIAVPTEIINIVADYVATRDFSQLVDHPIRFDQYGEVINPEIRAAYKEALMSAYCPPDVKSVLMRQAFSHSAGTTQVRLQVELRCIFTEIVDAGERVIFDNTCLDYLTFANVNWRRISLVNADMSYTNVIDVNVAEGDLTGLNVTAGEWIEVDAEKANLSGVNLKDLALQLQVNLKNVIGMENWPPEFTGHPVRSCPVEVAQVAPTYLTQLPVTALDTILDYMAETDFYEVSKLSILFHENGDVINPFVREGYKEAFMSSYCSPQIKSILMTNLFAPPDYRHVDRFALDMEGVAIFKEIVESGHRAYLDDVVLHGLHLQSINWYGASINNADLIDTTLINVNLRYADARDLDVVNGTWTDVDLEGANVGATQFQHLRVMDRVNLKDAIREPDADSW